MFSIHTHDHQTITSILFFPAVNNHRSSHVVLLASPNACVAECYYDCDPSVHFYTKLGYHVLVYDYRGSGGSTGDVTPENTVSDARLAVEFVEKKYKISLIPVFIIERNANIITSTFYKFRNAINTMYFIFNHITIFFT